MAKVTIVTPCYNSEKYVSETIQSVMNQSYRDWEYIIIDDGSTDNSLDVIESAVADDKSGRIRFHTQKNQGVCITRNKGAQLASTDSKYLLFLDADDIIQRSMLAKLVPYIDNRPDASFVFSLYHYIDKDGNVVSATVRRPRWEKTLFWVRHVDEIQDLTPTFSLMEGRAIPSSSLIRKDHFMALDGFDEDLGHRSEDTDLFVRLSIHGNVYRYPEGLLLYRQHSQQHTSNPGRVSSNRRALLQKWLHSCAETQSLKPTRLYHCALDYKSRVIPRIWLDHAIHDIKNAHISINTLLLILGSLVYYIYYGCICKLNIMNGD